MSDKIIHVTDNNFDSCVLKVTGLILVDFWAEWCGPCKMFSAILDEIAEECTRGLTIAKMNIDHNSAIPSKYSIRSIPTLLLFKDGAVVARNVGLFSKEELKNFLNVKF